MWVDLSRYRPLAPEPQPRRVSRRPPAPADEWADETGDIHFDPYRPLHRLPRESMTDVAERWLRWVPEDGPVAATTILAAVRDTELRFVSLHRAKRRMGILSVHTATFPGGWLWQLPQPGESLPKGARVRSKPTGDRRHALLEQGGRVHEQRELQRDRHRQCHRRARAQAADERRLERKWERCCGS